MIVLDLRSTYQSINGITQYKKCRVVYMQTSVKQQPNKIKLQQPSTFLKFQDTHEPRFKNQDINQLKLEDIQFSFQFPLTLKVGIIFATQQDIRKYIKKQQHKTKNMLARKIWKRSQNFPYLNFFCNYCVARIIFVKTSKGFKLSQLDVNHNHQLSYLKQLSKKQEREMQIQNNSSNAGNDSSYPTEGLRKNIYDIKNLGLCQIMKESNKNNYINYKGYPNLLKFIQQNNYIYYEQWGNQKREKGRFPQLMVFISQSMKANYPIFADVIYFNIYKHLISTIAKNSKPYEIAIFHAEDTNRRPVILGLVLFSYTQTEQYEKIFLKYFQVMRLAPPKSIVINQQDQITTFTLKNLINDQKFNGIFIFNVWYKLKRICQRFKEQISPGPNEIQLKRVKIYSVLLKKLMCAKSKVTAQNILKELQSRMENTQFKYDEIINGFLNTTDRSCFWLMPLQFIGLSRLTNPKNNEQIQATLKEKCSTQPAIDKFMSIFNEIDKQFNTRSIQQLCICPQTIQKCYYDLRLLKLRKQCQKQPYKAFFDNYIEARENIETHQGSNTTLINTQTQQIFKTINFSCNCGYYIKTGIPCSHTIFQAINKPNVQYIDLFDKRWIRKQHRSLQHQIKIIKKEEFQVKQIRKKRKIQ